jgi:hypothetical protein
LSTSGYELSGKNRGIANGQVLEWIKTTHSRLTLLTIFVNALINLLDGSNYGEIAG